MKVSVKPRLLGSLILFLSLFLLAIVLLSLFRDFLRENVLIPLLHFFWLMGLLVKSLDQGCIWGAGVILVALFSLMLLRRRTSVIPKEERTSSVPPARGRVAFWRNHLRLSSGDSIPSIFLSSELRRLVLEVLAYRHHLNPLEINRLVREKRMPLPQEVRFALEAAEMSLDKRSSLFGQLQKVWHSWLRRFRSSDNQSLARFEKIAFYLEEILEGTHETYY